MAVTKNNPSDLQRAAFILSIIGFFVPFLPIIALVFGILTKKEKPNNWRAKWAIGLGIAGIATSGFVILIFISYLVTVVGNSVMGSL